MIMKKNSKHTNAFDGAILFDGNMTVTLATGEKKTIRIDYLGAELKKADPDKEVIILLKGYAQYNEFKTGFIVHNPKWENGGVPSFGLKPIKEISHWSLHQYWDVIAWGYADGGLNNSRIYSCQCTPEQEAELERKRKEQGIVVPEAVSDDYDGIVLKFQHSADGSTGVQITTRKNRIDDYLTASKRWLADCMKAFMEFTEQNPDINEMHFYTKPTTWKEE